MGKEVDPKILLPPWRDRLPSGELGAEYGPKSVATFVRQVARYREWSWHPTKGRQQLAYGAALCRYMYLPDGSLRQDVPESERQVFSDVFEVGMTVRQVARSRGLARGTVRVYLNRLRKRLDADRQK